MPRSRYGVIWPLVANSRVFNSPGFQFAWLPVLLTELSPADPLAAIAPGTVERSPQRIPVWSKTGNAINNPKLNRDRQFSLYNRLMLAQGKPIKPVWRAVQAVLLTLLTAACTMPTVLDSFLSDAQSATERDAVTAPADPTSRPFVADLPVLGKAPELHDGAWLNTATPLSLAGLRGKVVALEMWTFG